MAKTMSVNKQGMVPTLFDNFFGIFRRTQENFALFKDTFIDTGKNREHINLHVEIKQREAQICAKGHLNQK